MFCPPLWGMTARLLSPRILARNHAWQRRRSLALGSGVHERETVHSHLKKRDAGHDPLNWCNTLLRPLIQSMCQPDGRRYGRSFHSRKLHVRQVRHVSLACNSAPTCEEGRGNGRREEIA